MENTNFVINVYSVLKAAQKCYGIENYLLWLCSFESNRNKLLVQI